MSVPIASVSRRRLVGLALLGPLAVAAALPAFAHHGWGWVSADQFVLTGIIRSAELGNPHGRLEVDVNGEIWVVEVGQPWRNHRAGLTDDLLSPGTEIEASGHRSRQDTERRMKAERVRIAGKLYDLYPDRQ